MRHRSPARVVMMASGTATRISCPDTAASTICTSRPFSGTGAPSTLALRLSARDRSPILERSLQPGVVPSAIESRAGMVPVGLHATERFLDFLERAGLPVQGHRLTLPALRPGSG